MHADQVSFVFLVMFIIKWWTNLEVCGKIVEKTRVMTATTPSRCARPSPSWPAQWPNWWPPYLTCGEDDL